ncbi:MAG: hypothetical protein DRJ56_03235 [Thermoprotei archaeon]|nr:MAG: hypothetical protein DRJ56_03235 [Thermoprotei archaeon]
MRAKRVKVALLGEGSVGKTTLAQALTGSPLSARATIGVEVHVLELEGVPVVIVDPSGQRRFWFAVEFALRGAHLACYVFDVSEPDTLHALVHYPKAAAHGVLVGNKIDIGFRVTKHEVEEVARRLGAERVFYTSALRGWGLDELASYIAKVSREL